VHFVGASSEAAPSLLRRRADPRCTTCIRCLGRQRDWIRPEGLWQVNFHGIWEQWHIRDVRNVRVFDVDPGDYHLFDGIEDLVRPSMKLRAMSEKKLRKEQLAQGWSNEVLCEHLRGDHDPEHADQLDEAILVSLRYNCLETEAYKFIPEFRLKELIGED